MIWKCEKINSGFRAILVFGFLPRKIQLHFIINLQEVASSFGCLFPVSLLDIQGVSKQNFDNLPSDQNLVARAQTEVFSLGIPPPLKAKSYQAIALPGRVFQWHRMFYRHCKGRIQHILQWWACIS